MPSYANSKDGLHIDGVTDTKLLQLQEFNLEILVPKLEIAKSQKSILTWIVYQN